MAALSILPPYPVFTNTDGTALDAGYVYIGTAGLNAQTNPISVYWDAALTIPAAQPIRTTGGYPSRNGSPAMVYANSDYSIIVRNKRGSLLYSSLNATPRFSSVVVSDVSSANVSFLQSGTGAVTRSVQTKLRDVVNVLDFGVAGDGLTDDTAALQNAATAAANKVLTFPGAGYTFKVTTNINLPSNIVIEGNGSTIRQYTANTSVLVASSKTNISIRGLQLYAVGSFSSITNGCGFAAIGCTYVDVDNCIVTNHRGAGILFYNTNHSSAQRNRLINSPVSNSDNHTQCAGDIIVQGSSSYNRVLSNECISGNGQGIVLQTITAGDDCSYNNVEGNIVANMKMYGILAYQLNATDTVKSNTILGNTIYNITGAVAHAVNGYVFGAGIYSVGSEDLLIEGNNIKSTHSAAVVFVDTLAPGAIGVTDCGRVGIIGNVIKTCGMYGITVRNPGTAPSTIAQVNVVGNMVANTNKVGIQVKEKANVNVHGNQIDTTAENGIHISNTVSVRTGISITANVVKNVTGSGILASYIGRSSISGNTVDTTSVHGIYVDNSQDVAVGDNVIYLHTTYGIGIDTVTRYTLNGNVVNGTGSSTYGYGLFSKGTLGRDNVVANCTTSFIGDYKPYYAAAPAAGTWAVGDIVYNSSPASAGYIGWVCTVAGTPGTWKTYGLIS